MCPFMQTSMSAPQVLLLSKSFRCGGCDPFPFTCVSGFPLCHSGGQYCPNLAGGANTDSHKGLYEKGPLEVSDPNPCSKAGLQSWIRSLRALPRQLLYISRMESSQPCRAPELVLNHALGEVFLSRLYSKLPLLQVMPIASCPGKGLTPSSLQPPFRQ